VSVGYRTHFLSADLELAQGPEIYPSNRTTKLVGLLRTDPWLDDKLEFPTVGHCAVVAGRSQLLPAISHREASALVKDTWTSVRRRFGI
jgi:hypothetical protein